MEIERFRTAQFPDHEINLTLRRGEILGLAGLVGAGRTELACSIFGVDRPIGGTIKIDGKTIKINEPRDAINHGIYLAPEDRKRAGCISTSR